MPQYCVKQNELASRLHRPVLHLTDSQGVETVGNRLPRGRKKEPRYGEWGYHAINPVPGPDISLEGITTFNAPASALSVDVGVTPPGALAVLAGKHALNAAAFSYPTDQPAFATLWRTLWRPSVWAIDWLTGRQAYLGELRLNPGTTGVLETRLVAVGPSGETVHTSSAIDDSAGTAGEYSVYETPLVDLGAGSGDVAIYRVAGGSGVNETGKSSIYLLRYIRLPDAATRYGEISMGWGGASILEHASSAGQPGSTRRYDDSCLDQMLSMLPIEGDAASGGVSGKVKVMLGQNGYVTGSQSQLRSWIDTLHQRVRASLQRVGKGDADVLLELVQQWDASLSRSNYSLSEQVRYDEIADVFSTYARENNARNSKVAYTPLGHEIRDRHGPLPEWTSDTGATGYLAGNGDFVHPNAAGSLYFPQVEVDLYLRADPSLQDIYGEHKMASYVSKGASIDYVPAADTPAATVVLQGDLIGATRTAIAAGQLGSLAVEGVFDFSKGTAASSGFTVGTLAYWDNINRVATKTATGNKLIGKAVRAASDADTVVRVRLSQ